MPMGILHVRDVPDEVIVALRRQAKESGRSLAAQVRHVLLQTARPKRRLDQLASSIAEVRAKYETQPTGVDDLIRDDRESH